MGTGAGRLAGVRGASPLLQEGSRCLGRSEVCGEVRFPVVLVLVFGGVAGRRRARRGPAAREGGDCGRQARGPGQHGPAEDGCLAGRYGGRG